ncbi:MAG: hypothetical protein IK149_06150 [Oscillospiraceae bacterium]|nr:hypothetical protein [Oscillospiraceae bacterium]
MKKGSLIGMIVGAVIVIAVLVLAVKLLSGAFALLHGAMDTVLGIVLIAALVAIVIWMFRYASKKRK